MFTFLQFLYRTINTFFFLHFVFNNPNKSKSCLCDGSLSIVNHLCFIQVNVLSFTKCGGDSEDSTQSLFVISLLQPSFGQDTNLQHIITFFLPLFSQ